MVHPGLSPFGIGIGIMWQEDLGQPNTATALNNVAVIPSEHQSMTALQGYNSLHEHPTNTMISCTIQIRLRGKEGLLQNTYNYRQRATRLGEDGPKTPGVAH